MSACFIDDIPNDSSCRFSYAQHLYFNIWYWCGLVCSVNGIPPDDDAGEIHPCFGCVICETHVKRVCQEYNLWTAALLGICLCHMSDKNASSFYRSYAIGVYFTIFKHLAFVMLILVMQEPPSPIRICSYVPCNRI